MTEPIQEAVLIERGLYEQQAQEIARLERERDAIKATLFKLYDREEELEAQLATAQARIKELEAERTLLQHRFDDAMDAIDKLQRP